MFIRLRAVDNFFFRDAAPFDAGTDEKAVSLFPPLPSSYAGALASFLTTSDSSDKPRIKIGFNGIVKDGQVHFPRPLDTKVIAAADDNGEDAYFIQTLKKVKAPVSSCPLPDVLMTADTQRGEKDPPGTFFLKEQEMNAYLGKNSQTLVCVSLEEQICDQNKVAIRIDGESGNVVQGDMAQIQMISPGAVELLVEADPVKIADHQSVKLGGENRSASVQKMPGQPFNIRPGSGNRYFKLYLATPALFKHGWFPGWLDPENFIGTFRYKKRMVKVRLICAATGRPLAAGGFGFDKRAGKMQPRELRMAVPAGSVYYFELLEGDFETAVKLFHGRCVSDYREYYDPDRKIMLGFERPRQSFDRLLYCDRGFGYCFVGSVDEGGKK